MFYKIRRKISKWLRRYFERRAQNRLKEYPELWRYLSSVVSPSTGCSYSDYWILFSVIRREKPKEILEFGSGISTVVIGHAIKQNGLGRLTSMEESEHYAAESRKLLPPEMKDFIQVHHSPSIEKRHGLFVGRGYEAIPDRPYDFVFVDGPQYERETSYDVDLLEIVGKSDRPISALVDSRAGSCVVYNLFLKRKFYFDYFQTMGYLKRATKNDLATYHNVITRELGDHSIKRTLLM